MICCEPPRLAGYQETRKAAGGIEPIDPDRPAMMAQVAKARRALSGELWRVGVVISERVLALQGTRDTAKAATDDDEAAAEADRILSGIDFAKELTGAIAIMQPRMVDAARLGALAGLDQIGIQSPPAELVTVLGDSTMAWAQDRAAELVGMRRKKDGTFFANPSAKWAIDSPTRDAVRAAVTNALAVGASSDELARAVLECGAFGKDRADIIARTEMAIADSKGAMISYRKSGVVQGKYWSTSEDDRVSEGCQEREEQGVIGIDDLFVPGGIDTTPGHPRCRCAVLPRLMP